MNTKRKYTEGVSRNRLPVGNKKTLSTCRKKAKARVDLKLPTEVKCFKKGFSKFLSSKRKAECGPITEWGRESNDK